MSAIQALDIPRDKNASRKRAHASLRCLHPECDHTIEDHRSKSGRTGRCKLPNCPCLKWRITVGRKPYPPRTKVLYKAPPQLEIPTLLIPQSSNDLRRLVLKLGIQSLRAELDRIEKEI